MNLDAVGDALHQTFAPPEKIPIDKLPPRKFIPDLVASTGDPLSKTNQEIRALGETTITRLDELTKRGLLKMEATRDPDHSNDVVLRYTTGGKHYAERHDYETELAVVKMTQAGEVSDITAKTQEVGGRKRKQYTQIHFQKKYGGYGGDDKLSNARMKQTIIAGRKNSRDMDDFERIRTVDIGGSGTDTQVNSELVKLKTGHAKTRFVQLKAAYGVDSRGIHPSETVVISVGDTLDAVKDYTDLHEGRWTTRVTEQVGSAVRQQVKERTLGELGELSGDADHVEYKIATDDKDHKTPGVYYAEAKVIAGKREEVYGKSHNVPIHDVALPGEFTNELKVPRSTDHITIRPLIHPKREYGEGEFLGPKNRDLAQFDMSGYGSVLSFAPSVPKTII